MEKFKLINIQYDTPPEEEDFCCDDYLFEKDHYCDDCGTEHCPEKECPTLEK